MERHIFLGKIGLSLVKLLACCWLVLVVSECEIKNRFSSWIYFRSDIVKDAPLKAGSCGIYAEERKEMSFVTSFMFSVIWDALTVYWITECMSPNRPSLYSIWLYSLWMVNQTHLFDNVWLIYHWFETSIIWAAYHMRKSDTVIRIAALLC